MLDAERKKLTADQLEMADFLLETCELEDRSEDLITVDGTEGTVHYGLGLCSVHMSNMTPEEIKLWVLTKLDSPN